MTKTAYEKHLRKIQYMIRRKKARENSDVLALSFGLENVIICPKAEISSFFYKQRLNLIAYFYPE